MQADLENDPEARVREPADQSCARWGCGPAGAPGEDWPSRCPSCGASAPNLQPVDGKACRDGFHSPPDDPPKAAKGQGPPVATPTEPPYVDLLAILHQGDCEHGNLPEVCARCDGDSPVPAVQPLAVPKFPEAAFDPLLGPDDLPGQEAKHG